MTTTFQQIWNALNTRVSSAPITECQAATRAAWIDICEEHEWSFLRAEGFLFIPTLVAGGTANSIDVTRKILTIDTATSALLATSDTADRPVIGRQFRLQNGPYYTISGFDSTAHTITLDQAFIDEVTYPFSGWSIYKVYYNPPKLSTGAIDFLRFRNPVGVSRIRNWPIMWPTTREQLDVSDRMRNQFAPPNRMAPYITDSTGIPRFELWPAPTEDDTYICYYVRNGELMFNVDSDTLPGFISRNLVFNRALYHLYEWCEANKFNPLYKAVLNGPNWFQLMSKCTTDWDGPLGELGKCWKLDQEAYPPDMHPLMAMYPGLNSVQWHGQYVYLPSPVL